MSLYNNYVKQKILSLAYMRIIREIDSSEYLFATFSFIHNFNTSGPNFTILPHSLSILSIFLKQEIKLGGGFEFRIFLIVH